MSRSGSVWDNAAMESFFSSLKTERTGRKTYRTRDEARADVFDYFERFYNQKRRHSKIGFMSPNGVRVQAIASLFEASSRKTARTAPCSPMSCVLVNTTITSRATGKAANERRTSARKPIRAATK
jgi:putative transposase